MSPTVTEQTLIVVEGDPNIADLLKTHLGSAGFRVLLAATGQRGLELIDQQEPSLALIDIGLPDMDGIAVCRKIRERGSMPVLFLTARDGEIDRTLGVELGADDYITKPFSPREATARVKAILRRHQPPAPADATVLNVGDDISIDLARREVQVQGRPIALATREFDLIAHLGHNQGNALTRQQLLDGVWGADWYGDGSTVDVHVRQLRKKLGDDLPLAAVWGIGYRLG